MFRTVEYKDKKLKVIDQRLLPRVHRYIECKDIDDVYHFIKTLAVRGAPAIGVFAAYGLYLGLRNTRTEGNKIFFRRLDEILRHIRSSRPTAVNLAWALDRMKRAAISHRNEPVAAIKKALLAEARKIQAEDEKMCSNIGKNGAALIKKGDTILTHCNAGALATAGEGTALAVIYRASREGKNVKVYADETRPLLQGARLTAWELRKKRIDVTLICDNMAAALMRQGKIDKVIVGADRIVRNGDTANKIGTYGLAVLAKEHGIPFYVAAPSSTLDLKIKSGRYIPIEQRDPDEVRKVKGVYIAPERIKVYNPAFDVTPHQYISAIITERGVLKKPFAVSIKRILG